jgi:hypothetical protein
MSSQFGDGGGRRQAAPKNIDVPSGLDGVGQRAEHVLRGKIKIHGILHVLRDRLPRDGQLGSVDQVGILYKVAQDRRDTYAAIRSCARMPMKDEKNAPPTR